MQEKTWTQRTMSPWKDGKLFLTHAVQLQTFVFCIVGNKINHEGLQDRHTH